MAVKKRSFFCMRLCSDYASGKKRKQYVAHQKSHNDTFSNFVLHILLSSDETMKFRIVLENLF